MDFMHSCTTASLMWPDQDKGGFKMDVSEMKNVNGIRQNDITDADQVKHTQENSGNVRNSAEQNIAAQPATASMTKADGTVVSQDGDTLNISGADHSSVRKLSSDGSGSMSVSGMKAGGTAGTKAGGGANVAISAASGSDSDSSDDNTNDLSQYTASELRTMLSNGEITEQEYQSELEKRSTQKTSDNAEQVTGAV